MRARRSEEPEERRLALTARADESDDLAWLHAQVDAKELGIGGTALLFATLGGHILKVN